MMTTTDKDIDEILGEAIRIGKPDEIANAIEVAGNPNYRTGWGYTPLGLAASSDCDPDGTFIRVEAVLANGGRVSEEETAVMVGTSVHIAAWRGHLKTLAALLAADGKVALNMFADMGNTPLCWAVRAGHAEAARMLLDAGADVNAHDEASNGYTALDFAVQDANIELVELLLVGGADPSIRTWMQMSALDCAEDEDQEHPKEMERIRELLRGAKPNAE